jgi:type I restriction enzyme M protein
MAKKTKIVKEKSIEDRIWESANKLRGNLNASEYQNVVLGLIFLKYISDCFEKRYKELVEEGDGFEEDRDEYTAEHVFWVPREARWKNIADMAHDPKIGTEIDKALELIEKENPRLKNVLPRNYARPEIDKIRLGEVVEIFNNVDMMAQGEGIDLFGRVYEYCLLKFSTETQQSGGEFYTPSCLVRTIVEVLQPFKGRVYDPACGSGGMFVQSAKFVEQHQGNLRNVTIYGQEFNANTWKMAQMNLAIRGLDANLGDSWGDSFGDDKHKLEKFDFVMANPPFNMKEWGAARLADDIRWKYGVPPEGNANFAWMQHMIHHLSPNGRIGMVLANGSLSSQSGGEGDIRQRIVEADLVEGIIAMPNQLFYNVSIPVCLWFLNRHKKNPGKVLFIDAREMGMMVDRTHRELSDDLSRYDYIKKEDKPWANLPAEECDVQKIAATFRAYENGTLEDVKGFCAVKTIEEISKQEYILTPGRYVGIAEAEDDGIPFEEKMEMLTNELSQLFAEDTRLQNEIREQLAKIGFTIK